jgi:hypothetical protein
MLSSGLSCERKSQVKDDFRIIGLSHWKDGIAFDKMEKGGRKGVQISLHIQLRYLLDIQALNLRGTLDM